jgi:hypothetical protein
MNTVPRTERMKMMRRAALQRAVFRQAVPTMSHATRHHPTLKPGNFGSGVAAARPMITAALEWRH